MHLLLKQFLLFNQVLLSILLGDIEECHYFLVHWLQISINHVGTSLFNTKRNGFLDDSTELIFSLDGSLMQISNFIFEIFSYFLLINE